MSDRMIILLTCFGLMTACQYDIPAPEGWKARELIENSSDLVTIGNNTYSLEAFLWRDFMPVSPPDGQPLIAVNSLIEVDEKAIPSHIDMDRQYVIMGDQVWESVYESGGRTQLHILEKLSRNGPKWGPHVFVTVVVRITDEKEDKEYLIRADDVYIERTD